MRYNLKKEKKNILMVTSNYVEGFSERTPFSCMKKKVLNIIDLRAWMKVSIDCKNSWE